LEQPVSLVLEASGETALAADQIVSVYDDIHGNTLITFKLKGFGNGCQNCKNQVKPVRF
jgi:hypothetical protein